MRKGFTLTEVVISIVILGLLAGIILVNVFDTKDKAIATHIEGNIAALQRATDAYYIEEEHYPTEREPSFGRPEKLLLDWLSPKYIHKADFDAVKHQTYMVDVDGRVWGSTAGNPEVIFETQEGVRWTPSERAVAYDVYQDLGRQADVNHRLKKVARLEGLPETDQYLYRKKGVLLSAVDRFGKATAPTMVGTSGFVPRIDFEGTFDYIVEGDDEFVLDEFQTWETKPEGTSISSRFTTYDEKGDVLKKDLATFPEGEKANKIKVSFEMKGANGKKPSLRGVSVYYHHEGQEVLTLTPIPKEDLPKGLLEECGDDCKTYSLPLGTKTEQVFDIRKKKEQNDGGGTSSEGIVSETRESPRYVVQNGYVLSFFDGVSPKEERLTVVKDSSLSIGEPMATKEELSQKSEEDKNPAIASPVISEKGWTTLESPFVIAGNPKGDSIHWIEAIIEDEIKDKENTKIVYRYSYFDGDGFVGGYKSLDEMPSSPSVRLTANRMVRTKMLDKTTEPEFKSATFRSEKGVVTLDGVRPTAFISYEKDNNVGRDVISTTSKVTWEYEAFDPRKKEIVETRWSGDVATHYPTSGKKTVYLEIKNSSGYWSNRASYTFEVKDEIPVAKLSADYAVVRTGETIDWAKADQSYDPDGDEIIDWEWQGVSKQYTSDGIAGVARLRVKDVEGNWSSWTELRYSSCKDVCFKGAPTARAWDGSLTTTQYMNGTVLTWDGELTGRTVTFDIANFSGSAAFSIQNKNGEDITTYVTTYNVYTKNILVPWYAKSDTNGRKILSVVMPEKAASIRFQLGTYVDVNEILVGSANISPVPQNLKVVPGSNAISLTWDKVVDAQKYEIYQNGGFVGESVGTSFTAKTLFSNTKYSFEVKSVEVNGSYSKGISVDTATLDDGINFRGMSTAKAWDGILSTTENTRGASISWSGDLQGRVVGIDIVDYAADAKFSVKDKDGNDLPIYLTSTNVRTKEVMVSWYLRNADDRKKIFFIMPEGAKTIQFQNTNIYVAEISVGDANIIDPVSKVMVSSETKAIGLSWDAVVGAKKYVILENGAYVGESVGTSYLQKSLFSNMSYRYEVMTVGANGSYAKPTAVQTSTLDDGINFRGAPTAKAWDGISTSRETLTGATITWDGMIQGRTVSLHFYDYAGNAAFSVKDANGNDLTTYVSTVNLSTKNIQINSMARAGRLSFVMPENAKSIKFTGGYTYVYELSVTN